MGSVRLDGVAKRFDGSGAAAVDGVSLTITDGEFAVFVGPSGCGKTTVLRMIAGLETPTAGRIFIDGRDVTDLPPRERDIAMVFQNYALYPHLSVRENIAFGLRMRRVAPREIVQRVARVADSLGIGELLDRRPAQLSGGQRQRVALARAIVREPAVFLFDEPLSNLDAQVRAQTRGELVRLHRRLGTTMIYVTHDQVEAMTMAQRVAVMNKGRVEQQAPPLEVYRAPSTLFVATFVGSPSINCFRGRIVGDDAAPIFDGAVQCRVAAPLLEVATLAVRPEHLALVPTERGSRGEVTLVEPLGPETILHVRLAAGEEATLRLPAGPAPAVGTTVGISVRAPESLVYDRAGRLAGRGVE
ncbi:MAG TPA: sn-glycerol-3-phosphate ABC transporter ATP-binding protein UgpC [Gemmatimonadaceae bacterium]|nr:sn-glycerol-3-phosphate ABC transporter ATP-binding protein UgpC [Gemmatimonadaceae bacterium]